MMALGMGSCGCVLAVYGGDCCGEELECDDHRRRVVGVRIYTLARLVCRCLGGELREGLRELLASLCSGARLAPARCRRFLRCCPLWACAPAVRPYPLAIEVEDGRLGTKVRGDTRRKRPKDGLTRHIGEGPTRQLPWVIQLPAHTLHTTMRADGVSDPTGPAARTEMPRLAHIHGDPTADDAA